MKLDDLGKPQTPEGVRNRMILRRIDPKNKNAYRSNVLCHSISIDYFLRARVKNAMIVMVGVGNLVTHSFVTDFNNKIIVDSFMHKNPTYDGKYYTVDGKSFKVISILTYRMIDRLLDQMEEKMDK